MWCKNNSEGNTARFRYKNPQVFQELSTNTVSSSGEASTHLWGTSSVEPREADRLPHTASMASISSTLAAGDRGPGEACETAEASIHTIHIERNTERASIHLCLRVIFVLIFFLNLFTLKTEMMKL
jgi:hypothetical protein